MEDETFLTVPEAAKELGVSDSAIRNATLEGRLPFVKKYGRKLISRQEVLAYQERTQPNGVKPTGRPAKVERPSVA